MKKTISLLVIFVLILGISFIYSDYAKAIKNFKVEVMNKNMGASSDYRFIFTIEKTLNVGKYIKIILPSGTEIELNPIMDQDDNTCTFCKMDIKYLGDNSIEVLYYSKIELDPSREGYADINLYIKGSGKYKDSNGDWFQYKLYNPKTFGDYSKK